MILIDSNILIYSAEEAFSYLRKLFQKTGAVVSIISKLEVLGYHKITPKQIIYFDAVFKLTINLPITDELISQAIKYRKLKSMSVGDSSAMVRVSRTTFLEAWIRFVGHEPRLKAEG
jgi:hypothetical protein